MAFKGDSLPTGVPVVRWEDYRLEEERPDIIFIHNPYDDGNNLTSVPLYLPYRLIQPSFAHRRIYIPYLGAHLVHMLTVFF